MIKYESLYWNVNNEKLVNYSEPVYCYSFSVKKNCDNFSKCKITYRQRKEDNNYFSCSQTYDVSTFDIIQPDTISPEKIFHKRVSGIIRAIRSYKWKKSLKISLIDKKIIYTIQTNNNNDETNEFIKNKYFCQKGFKTKNGKIDFFEKSFFLPQWCSNLNFQKINEFSICSSNVQSNVQSNVHGCKCGNLMEIE